MIHGTVGDAVERPVTVTVGVAVDGLGVDGVTVGVGVDGLTVGVGVDGLTVGLAVDGVAVGVAVGGLVVGGAGTCVLGVRVGWTVDGVIVGEATDGLTVGAFVVAGVVGAVVGEAAGVSEGSAEGVTSWVGDSVGDGLAGVLAGSDGDGATEVAGACIDELATGGGTVPPGFTKLVTPQAARPIAATTATPMTDAVATLVDAPAPPDALPPEAPLAPDEPPAPALPAAALPAAAPPAAAAATTAVPAAAITPAGIGGGETTVAAEAQAAPWATACAAVKPATPPSRWRPRDDGTGLVVSAFIPASALIRSPPCPSHVRIAY